MKINKLINMLGFMLCLFAAASSAQSVDADFDRTFDFSKMKTFDFAIQKRAAADPLAQDSLNDERIKNALISTLKANGFRFETSAKPDFAVAYFVTTKKKFDLREYGYGLPRWLGSRDIRVDQYTEGTLTVDIIDAATNQLVWRGRASSSVELKNIDKKIKKAVEKLASQFVRDSRRKT